ncbi:MAG: hypothetical protein DRQ55_05820 [Planctomycetota bacterium]|nr:MAG: hypothetical protein DRQ55_05820 [Planctomycetota bacterium]
MAKCNSCQQKGLLFRVDKVGLCKTCRPRIDAEIETHSNAIYEDMHVFERAQDPAGKLAAIDHLLAASAALLPYEEWGMQTCSPPAKLVHAEYTGFRDELTRGG